MPGKVTSEKTAKALGEALKGSGGKNPATGTDGYAGAEVKMPPKVVEEYGNGAPPPAQTVPDARPECDKDRGKC